MTRDEYVGLIADLINRDPPGRHTRERRVREANRRLYKALVDKQATAAQADLALAHAAAREQGRRT